MLLKNIIYLPGNNFNWCGLMFAQFCREQDLDNMNLYTWLLAYVCNYISKKCSIIAYLRVNKSEILPLKFTVRYTG